MQSRDGHLERQITTDLRLIDIEVPFEQICTYCEAMGDSLMDEPLPSLSRRNSASGTRQAVKLSYRSPVCDAACMSATLLISSRNTALIIAAFSNSISFV
jgi:hypothetical protein